jgi:plastocyanin
MGKRERRREVRERRRRLRTIAFGVVVLVVLGLSGYLLASAFARPDLQPLAGKVIDIDADMSGFSQSEVRLKVGEAVTVRLTSLDNSHHTDGGGKHQWAVDELGVNIITQPESSASPPSPTQPGQYTFYCDICCGGRQPADAGHARRQV